MQRTLENNVPDVHTEAPNLKRPASAVRLSSGEERAGSRLTAPAAPEMAIRTRSLRARLRFTASLWIGVVLLGIVVAAALTAPLIAPYPPEQLGVAAPLESPSRLHPFGADNLGRDLFSRVVFGARIALTMALSGMAIGVSIGVTLGVLAGYYNRWIDRILSRMMEVWLAFPALLLAILVVARLGASLQSTIIALGIVGAPAYFRLVRSGTLTAKHSLFVEAARATGASDIRILIRHVLPSTASSIIVLASMRSGLLLLAGAGLSFIGLGAQPPQPEWGALLATGRTYLDAAPWMAVFPGLAITLTVVGFNLFGDGLRDALDPLRSNFS